MNYKKYDDMMILFFAFRYSLPPSTIGRDSVLNDILKNRAKISKTWKLKMVEEARTRLKDVKEITKNPNDLQRHDLECMENFIKVMEKECDG